MPVSMQTFSGWRSLGRIWRWLTVHAALPRHWAGGMSPDLAGGASACLASCGAFQPLLAKRESIGDDTHAICRRMRADAADRDSPTPMSIIRTFIVEDSPVILDNLVAALEELAPVKVIGSARDEAGALRWLGESAAECDLLIVDIFLDSGSGIGVLRSIRGFRTAAKRVVLSNYATPQLREHCRALGADRVFDKSSEFDDLIFYCRRLASGYDTAPGGLD
jgi:two-component system, OmpR family, response regulator